MHHRKISAAASEKRSATPTAGEVAASCSVIAYHVLPQIRTHVANSEAALMGELSPMVPAARSLVDRGPAELQND